MVNRDGIEGKSEDTVESGSEESNSRLASDLGELLFLDSSASNT